MAGRRSCCRAGWWLPELAEERKQRLVWKMGMEMVMVMVMVMVREMAKVMEMGMVKVMAE
jgi:hypothetical protein